MEFRPALVDNLERCDEIVRAALTAVGGRFIARVGGSDTDLLIYLHNLAKTHSKAECLEHTATAIDIVKRYNGYYDVNESPENIFRFYDVMVKSVERSTEVFLGGPALLTEFLPNSIHEKFRVDNGDRREPIRAFILEEVVGSRHKTLLPYSYVEHLTLGTTLFRLLSTLLSGKKVLVVSPFKASIEENFHNRSNFFKNYDYPEFDLLAYETPITYPDLPPSFYPDQDWFETGRRMAAEISELEFDIALLSCGSYAMVLGDFIASNLQRKAIYVGGCLQLYFGVMGRRYNDPFFLDQINISAFIRPVESQKYLAHTQISSTTAAEAFGAYF